MNTRPSWQIRSSTIAFVSSLLLTHAACTCPSAPVIVTPPALLVPNNTKIVLTCHVHIVHDVGPSPLRWIKNRTDLIEGDDQNFITYVDAVRKNNYTIHKLEFNATSNMNVNNTKLSCLIDSHDCGGCESNNTSLVILTGEYPNYNLVTFTIWLFVNRHRTSSTRKSMVNRAPDVFSIKVVTYIPLAWLLHGLFHYHCHRLK